MVVDEARYDPLRVSQRTRSTVRGVDNPRFPRGGQRRPLDEVARLLRRQDDRLDGAPFHDFNELLLCGPMGPLEALKAVTFL